MVQVHVHASEWGFNSLQRQLCRRAVEETSGRAAERKCRSRVIWRPVCSSAALLFCCSLSAAAERLNILFIITDDHAYQAVSCYDGTRRLCVRLSIQINLAGDESAVSG